MKLALVFFCVWASAATHVTPQLLQESFGSTNSWWKLDANHRGCVVNEQITTKDECEKALKFLGLPAGRIWAGDSTQVPMGCSVTDESIAPFVKMDAHFNTGKRGAARADSTPVCKGMDPGQHSCQRWMPDKDLAWCKTAARTLKTGVAAVSGNGKPQFIVFRKGITKSINFGTCDGKSRCTPTEMYVCGCWHTLCDSAQKSPPNPDVPAFGPSLPSRCYTQRVIIGAGSCGEHTQCDARRRRSGLAIHFKAYKPKCTQEELTAFTHRRRRNDIGYTCNHNWESFLA